MELTKTVMDAGSTTLTWKIDFDRVPFVNLPPILYFDSGTSGSEGAIQDIVQKTYGSWDDHHIEKILQRNTHERQYADYKKKIKSFAYLGPEWNPYGAAPPNSEAINKALHTLAIVRDSGIFPDLVNPSVEEGIVFEWKVDDKFFLFEFYNDGEIIYLKREGDEESHVSEINLDEIPLIIREVANA